MVLKQLEIQGFKSFPDRTRILIEPGITAVVGPNGSGKSNISDAIRQAKTCVENDLCGTMERALEQITAASETEAE